MCIGLDECVSKYVNVSITGGCTYGMLDREGWSYNDTVQKMWCRFLDGSPAASLLGAPTASGARLASA